MSGIPWHLIRDGHVTAQLEVTEDPGIPPAPSTWHLAPDRHHPALATFVRVGHNRGIPLRKEVMGSLVKKRRKKMSKHKYRKRIKANRHKKKN